MPILHLTLALSLTIIPDLKKKIGLKWTEGGTLDAKYPSHFALNTLRGGVGGGGKA